MPRLPDTNDWIARERRAIGDRIRVNRLRQNRTQESVFLEARIARSAYQQIEAGTADARIGTLLRIAHVLGLHVVDLLRDR